MCDVPVFYATTEGQTRRIAEYMSGRLRERGLTSEAIEVTSRLARDFDWTRARAAMLGASLHAGKHQRAACRFARAHVGELNARPSVFFSVSLAAGSKSASGRKAARNLAEGFADAVRWTPRRVVCVAGRLAYTQYGFVTRWFMKRIAAKEGGGQDTRRDYEYTDWAAVSAIADDLADTLARSRTAPSAA